MKKYKTRKWILRGLAFLLPTILLVLCFRKFDLHQFLTEVERVHLGFFSAALLCTTLILFAMAVQWRLFLPQNKPVSFGRMFQVVSLFTMLVNTVPFWGGQAFVIYFLGEKEKVGKTATLSLLTLEQITEGFGKLGVLTAVALFCPFPPWMKKGMEGLFILVFAAFFILIFLAYRFRDLPEKQEKSPSKVWKKLVFVFVHWAHHLHALRNIKKISGGILLNIVTKLLELVAIWLVQKSLNVELPFYAPLLVVAAVGFATLLPISPGRLGVFEAAVYWIYVYLGVDSTRSLLLGFFIHIVHTLPLILVGYGVSLKLGFKRKEISLYSEDEMTLAGSKS